MCSELTIKTQINASWVAVDFYYRHCITAQEMIIIVLFLGYCPEGFVQCLVDPCRTAWCPIGTKCVSNSCGGCNYDCSKFIINFAFNFL